MSADKMKAFFSCSFALADAQVNEVFLALCEGLGLVCSNVAAGSVITPPNVARTKINQCDLLVAVCTRRDQLVSGGYTMPVAVRNEIGIALGRTTPIVMFVETGVDVAGFENNVGTYHTFDRSKLSDIHEIKKIVETIHDSRTLIAEGKVPYVSYGRDDARCERMDYVVSLESDGGEYSWCCEVTKKLVYLKRSKQPMPCSYWAELPETAPADAAQIEYSVTTDGSSRGIHVIPKIERQTAQVIEVTLSLKPTPEKDDWVEYTTCAKSPHLNFVWCDDPKAVPNKSLSGEKYAALEGIIPLHKTDKLVVEIKFPKTYGLTSSDLRPFAASYTSGIDYELESETERADVKVKSAGRLLVATMEIDRPLLHHMYGFAWNPPCKPE